MSAVDRDEQRLSYRARAADAWHPEGTRNQYGRRRPEVGDVIAWERRAWEVTHVRVEEPAEAEEEDCRHYSEPYRDERLPYRITLRRLYGAKHPRENSAGDVPLRAPAGMSARAFSFYESHRVPLCSCCGDPWPCLLADAEVASEASAELMEARMARMGPGICYGCGEVITTRQGKFTMRGDHADFPGAPAPTFHARKKCDQQMLAYKRRAGIGDDEPVPTLNADHDR